MFPSTLFVLFLEQNSFFFYSFSFFQILLLFSSLRIDSVVSLDDLLIFFRIIACEEKTFINYLMNISTEARELSLLMVCCIDSLSYP
jgi:hypothetical protein